MNSVCVLIAAACLGIIQAAPSLQPLPVNPGGIGGLFRGPNSETIIQGPDGSQITSEQIGGDVQIEPRLETIIVPDQIALPSVPIDPGVPDAIDIQGNIPLASPAPILAGSDVGVDHIQQVSVNTVPIATSQAIAIETPIVTSAQEPHIIETELVDAPEIEPDQSSDLKGPSGTISVRGSSSIVSGPASTTISEPVRRIPLAPISIAPVSSIAPVPVPISTVSVAPVQVVPAPISAGPIISNPVESVSIQSQLRQHESIAPSLILTPPEPAPSVALSAPPSLTAIRTDLVGVSETPLISLGGTSGAGIADASFENHYVQPQVSIISSTARPQLSLPTQTGIPLGQSIISTTQSPISGSSEIDIDPSRINLRQGSVNAEQQLIPSNLASLAGHNIISSTSEPILLSQNSVQSGISSVPPNIINRPLLTTASELRGISSSNIPLNTATVSSIGRVESPNLSLIPNVVHGNVNIQDQAVLTNQVVSNTQGYTTIDGRNIISPLQSPLGDVNVNRRPWLNIEPTPSPLIPTNVVRGQAQNFSPIGSVLDSVLVQPTDPRNREVIEFAGKQLENVGNIVPVVNNHVLVTGDVRNVQQVPTASISQLSLRNDLDPTIYNRYGRDAKKKN